MPEIFTYQFSYISILAILYFGILTEKRNSKHKISFKIDNNLPTI